MREVRLSLLLSLMAVAMLGLAACGDDDDDGRLTDEEYFAELTRLDKELDDRGEELFRDEEPGANALADFYRDAAENYQDELDGLNPPEDLQDEHDALAAALKAFGDAVADVGFEDDAPAGDFFEHEGLAEPFAAVDPPFCALQAIADERGIDADVGCGEED